ncbi:RNB domain-containing ribonuclease [Methanocella conradii]|uniref:RNB domain-containing ribonuclease n=1 Tax=Methanocella conradii TaxID=1175444 RepID=UPI0024B39C45|nr:RNB domain-containing ribonuclease [Methanocella conradii]MDI6896718.1 RNB domain-containing ribonuclease [Methanocella conradii]
MYRGVTIDDRATMDMDDAIWVDAAEDGSWKVRVMVADVARAAQPRSKLDGIAMARVETRYFARGSSPMLPRRLSEEKLSLWPGEPKSVLVVDIDLDERLNVLDTRLSMGTMESEARLSYSDVPLILSDAGHPQHSLIETARRLAQGLLMVRRNRGALVYYDVNTGWVTGEEGTLKKLKSREDTIGYVIIQELMILANMAVAEYAVKNDVPILFRNHTARSAAPEREELMKLLESAAVVPAERLATIRRTTSLMFNRAEYGASILGHFGLNLGVYTHFTSPIRRYADLVNHQQLRAHIMGKPLPYSKENISGIAAHINRKLIEYDEARSEYMKKKADRMAEEAIQAGQIEGVGDKEFEHITKLLIRGGEDCPEAYHGAFLSRLASGKMPLLCAGLVLTQAPAGERWTGLKAALLERLAKEPNLAVTVFNLAQQLSGWPMPSYDITGNGAPLVFTARATVQLDGKSYESGEFKDASKKGAMQRASVGLLASILGLPVPAMAPPRLAQPAPVNAEIAINTSKDPIVALQEYGQANKLPLPSYSFSMDGPPNKPLITCTCVFNSITATGQASSKQRAKRRAAKAVIDILLGLQ